MEGIELFIEVFPDQLFGEIKFSFYQKIKSQTGENNEIIRVESRNLVRKDQGLPCFDMTEKIIVNPPSGNYRSVLFSLISFTACRRNSSGDSDKTFFIFWDIRVFDFRKIKPLSPISGEELVISNI